MKVRAMGTIVRFTHKSTFYMRVASFGRMVRTLRNKCLIWAVCHGGVEFDTGESIKSIRSPWRFVRACPEKMTQISPNLAIIITSRRNDAAAYVINVQKVKHVLARFRLDPTDRARPL